MYHIYNRGNNSQPIFFNDENYLYFLRKVRIELAGYFSFLSYCLMPNHFHFLVQVKDISVNENHSTDDINPSDRSKRLTRPTALSGQTGMDPIARKIGTLLSSYTQAINKQQNKTGSLFQQKTKAKCLNEHTATRNNYVTACFHYIHQNPVSAGIVQRLEEWRYSSFLDYAGLRDGTLCNQQLAIEVCNLNRQNFIGQSYAVFDEKSLKGIWV